MFRITLAVVAACLSTGCASIVSGQNQSLSVTAKNNGADVVGAKCQLSNDKGTWFTTTPGSIMVRRSYNDLAISCTADGAAPGVLTVKSSTKGMAFGNMGEIEHALGRRLRFEVDEKAPGLNRSTSRRERNGFQCLQNKEAAHRGGLRTFRHSPSTTKDRVLVAFF